MRTKILSLLCVISLTAIVMPFSAFALDDDSIIRTLALDQTVVDAYGDGFVTATFDLAEAALAGTYTAEVLNNFIAVPTVVTDLPLISLGACVESACPYKVVWGGKNSNNEPVMEGTYELHISASFGDSSDEDIIDITVVHVENMIQNFEADKETVDFGAGEVITFTYEDRYEHVDVHSIDIYIHNELGQMVKPVTSITQTGYEGEYSGWEFTWDGLTDEDVMVDYGTYTAYVYIENLDGTSYDVDEVSFDFANGNLLKDLEIDMNPVNFEEGDTLKITYKGDYFSSGEFFENLILNSDGETVRDLDGGTKTGEDGDYWVWELVWDGKNDAGASVGAGTYRVSLTVENAAGTKTETEILEFVVEGVEVVDDTVDDPTDDPDVTLDYIEIEEDSDQEEYACGFPDVLPDHAYCDSILWAKGEGIFQGDHTGDFNPAAVINRAEVLAVIMRAFDLSLYDDDGTDLGWSDVIVGAWYMKYLRSGKMHDILHGDGGADTVRPGDGVNRVEFLKLIMKSSLLSVDNFELENCGAAPYSDVETDLWYSDYVCTEKALDLFDTYDNLFLPANGTTRAEVAEALHRMFE